MMNALGKTISPHSPRIGDVYKSKSDCRFVKLTGLTENRAFTAREYDFDKHEFCLSHFDLSEGSLDSYYEYVVDKDFGSLVETAEQVFVEGYSTSVKSVDEETMLMKRYPMSHSELVHVVRQAIEWWKHKVIYKRALKSDDAKAWKMIWNKVMKEICESI